jgi:hypothetical protein
MASVPFGFVLVQVQVLNDSTSSKVYRRECYFASEHVKLVKFTLLLCTFTECSSPDAAASRHPRQRPSVQISFTLFFCSSAQCSSPAAAESRGRRQLPKHRPEHQDEVRKAFSEGAAGNGLGTTVK